MYLGSLAAASNRADWIEVCTLIDSDSGDTVDITGCRITLSVRPQNKSHNGGDDYDDWSSNSSAVILQGSTDSGEIVIVDIGSFQWTFPATRMSALCEKTYDVGVRISRDGRTVQLMVGQLPILEGIDMQ